MSNSGAYSILIDRPYNLMMLHRDKMQTEKKASASKMDEENDERRKEMALLRGQLQKEREELRGQQEADNKMMAKQLEKEANDLLAAVKKERSEREKADDMIKTQIDNERKELQISIDKDRENVTRRLAEEHDMRRIEQMEMQQRLDNNEKSGKTDITDIYG